MIFRKEVIYCKESTGRKFRVVNVEFRRSSRDDVKFIESLISRSMDMADQVNRSAANNAGKKRSKERVLANCIAGLLSEVCWKEFINNHYGDGFVTETVFENASNQIDLLVKHTGKKIEVRSSFPRNGIKFALCDKRFQFDVIGPYTNHVKISEPAKHFYVRTLFPVDVRFFRNYIEQEVFNVYLTGGATWEMMMDKNLYVNKNLVPEDSIVEQESTYRVIPFSRALDTFEILEKLKY